MGYLFRTVLVAMLAFLLAACEPAGWIDQHGRQITDDALRGHRTVVNYWAQWCAPCREELPELNRLAQDFPEARVIGIDFDGMTGEALLASSEEMGIEFSVLGQDFAQSRGLAKPEVLPTTYILDEQGALLHTLRGPQHYDDIAPLLAPGK
jgi:thiol-disulfide isomerase/thioredoxin